MVISLTASQLTRQFGARVCIYIYIKLAAHVVSLDNLNPHFTVSLEA
jgi:hypothetical protein